MKKSVRIMSVGVLLAMLLTMGLAAQPAFCWGGECDNPGVRSPGYWMNHPEAWPVDSIQIGNDLFTKDEAIDIMFNPVEGDKTYTMFPALVAAKLNVRIGNCDCNFNIWMLIGEAQSWFRAYPLGSGVDADSDAWQYSHGEWIYWRLDAYNNGQYFNGDFCAPPADP
jgi:hypothetical protein